MKFPSLSRRILPVIAIIGIAVAAFLIFSTQPDTSLDDPARKPPTTPRSQIEGGTVAGAGLVEPASELIEIGTNVPGVVTRIFVQPGDRVAKGEPLFKIEDRDARARIEEAQARVRLAQANLAAARTRARTAQAQLALYARVEDPRAIAEQEVIGTQGQRDDARAAIDVARADLTAARAALQSARTNLGLLTVRAPAPGEVLQVKTRPGQFASTGPAPGGGQQDPLMVIGETRPLHVRVDIDENEIERADIGASAVISPRGNARLRTRVDYVRTEPLVVPKRSLTNSSSERVDVRVLQLIYRIPQNSDDRYYVGQQVDAFVPAKKVAADNAGGDEGK